MITLSFWLILVAGVAHMIIGSVWYHPSVFGKKWMELSGFTPQMVEKQRRRMPLGMLFGLLAGMLTAYVLTFSAAYWGVYDVAGSIELAFWMWAGLVVPVLLGGVLWEGKPLPLYFINIGYWLVSLIVMMVILIAL